GYTDQVARIDSIFILDRFFENCSVFDAELWGILDGLALLMERGYDNVLIQTDNLEVAKTIQDGS
ncbi:hypothetical protein Gorai_009128, partial [Gossypium raimondii]|nr:hypothetical protein [Gossypium raimondii]